MNQIDGTPVYQISWHTLEPLIENNKLSIRAAAVSFQNLGEQDVKVNHHWTIQAGGGTLHIGDEKSTNILVQEFQIQFSGTGTQLSGDLRASLRSSNICTL